MDTDEGEVLAMAPHTMPAGYAQDRNRLQYELTVRQEPKQARMCGIGGKADRRPIDPPVIVQLRVIDPAVPSASSAAASSSSAASGSSSAAAAAPGASASSSSSAAAAGPNDELDADPTADGDGDADDPPYSNLPGYAQSFLQNPYYFMFASLAKPDDDTELHWLKDGRTRCTTGSVVSSLYALKDPTAVAGAGSGGGGGKDGKDGGPTTASPASDAGFFVFPDLSVRTEGSYRLKLSLFEVVGNDVRHCKSIYSAPFYVYTAKKFPGVEESSPLTCSLADQGIKIRIRKDIRMRKARGGGGGLGDPRGGLLPMGERGGGLIEPPPSDGGGLGMPTVDPDPPVVDDKQNSHRPAKRSRTDDGAGNGNTGGAPPVGTAWPSTPLIPPPPGAEIQGPQGQVGIQGAPMQGQGQGQGQVVIPPPPPPASGPPQDVGYDVRGAAYQPYESSGHHIPVQHPAHQQQQQQQQQHPGQQQQQQHIPPPPPPGYRADAMPPPPPPPHPGYAPGPYQHPYYAHAYPPPWAGAPYSDPYAHPHAHAHHHPHAQQHAQYAPPMRYDYGYPPPPPPPPPPHYAPYYEQPGQPGPQAQPQQQGYGEYAQQQQQQGYGPPPGQGQQQAGVQQGPNGNGNGNVGMAGGAPNVSSMALPNANPNASVPSMGGPAGANMTMGVGAGPGPGPGGMVPPNANMGPNPGMPQQQQQQQNANMVVQNPGMVPMAPNPNMAAANPNMAASNPGGPNPNARGPPPQYYRPYVQPPPYYGYAQPQPPQPQHEAHAWGTPPSGFPPPPQVWGEYAPQPPPHVVQQQPGVGGHAIANGGGVGQQHGQGQGQVQQQQQQQQQQHQAQGQVGALRSPNARIELAPLRPREEEGGADSGAGSSPPGGHPIIQLRSGSAVGGGAGRGSREAGKKNPLSIGSIISDETH